MTAFQGMARGMAQIAQEFQANSSIKAPETLLVPKDEGGFRYSRSPTPLEEWIAEQHQRLH
jgi:hypothetical protein